MKPGLTKVLQNMPLGNRLSTFCEHFVPMFHFHRSAFTTQHHLSYKFVATHSVIIHTGYQKRCMPDFLVRYIEDKWFIEYWIKRPFFYSGFFLLHLFPIMAHPDFHIWIWNKNQNLYSIIFINHFSLGKLISCYGIYFPGIHFTCRPDLNWNLIINLSLEIEEFREQKNLLSLEISDQKGKGLCSLENG